jgi:hypothetical protein
MKSSMGRHGGNHGKTDKGEARNQRAQAAQNSDADSLEANRNDSRAGGRKPGA